MREEMNNELNGGEDFINRGMQSKKESCRRLTERIIKK